MHVTGWNSVIERVKALTFWWRSRKLVCELKLDAEVAAFVRRIL